MSPRSASHPFFVALAAASGLAAQDPPEPSSGLSSPKDTIQAIRSAFNAAKGKPRFLAVLSPT